MRLERVDIAGFGRLRRLSIDLSPRLTVIVGGNETGKSTLHRAIRASLYGLDAGGQGRAVERSPWTRWMPWAPGPYGVAMTYSLVDGSRFRVARRLDQREHAVQVQEIGGADVTAAMRIGRSVAPGQVHLGIDEAVFCATAWLGDDGLLSSSPHAAGQRAVASRLQEAIERLADTGHGVTAAAAVARLREAMSRVGSERRSGTPLGVAATRLKQLDREIENARRRATAIADDEARLAHLEKASAEAAARSLECERAWLLGRLARIAVERSDLADAAAEAVGLDREIEATSIYADFPLDDEDRVIALGGELHQCLTSAAESQARADISAPPLAATRQRRAEIVEGLEALGKPLSLGAPGLNERSALEHALAAESGVDRRIDEMRRAEACADQLRRQIAATGLAGVPPGAVESYTALFDRALAPNRRRRGLTAAVSVMAAAAALGLSAQVLGRGLVAALALVGGGIAAAVIALVGMILGSEGGRARRELGRQCPGLDVSREGLEIAASRLPTLRRLQDELRRFEILVDADRVEIEATRQRVAQLAICCASLVDRLGLEPPWRSATFEPRSIEEHMERARSSLRAVSEAVDRRLCWDRRVEEDQRLAQDEASLALVMEEAAHCAAQVRDIEDQVHGILVRGGLDSRLTSAEAVAAFRAACEGRRRHEEAHSRRLEVERRIAAIGSDEASLARRAKGFTGDLRARGVDDAAIASALPLQGNQLDRLENEVDRARSVATSSAAEAAALRARLGGALECLPSLPALADERASCAAARERGLSQIAALERAIELIEAATRHVHRDLAPRLSDSVAERISLITDGRYQRVNIDTEHFAVSLFSSERCELVPLALVSRGTRDQVSLLLRLALSELLGDSGEKVPLLLDEPLLSADQERGGNALDFIAGLSELHQVVMTTSDPRVADLMRQRLGGDCAVLALDPVAPSSASEPVEIAAYTRR